MPKLRHPVFTEMRITYNWIKEYVDLRISPEELARRLTMGGFEVTSMLALDSDTIMELEITPNRSDCLSILGIAGEVAAILGKRVKFPKIPSLRGRSLRGFGIQIKDKIGCPRYIGRVIKGIKVKPSPEWLIRYLEAMGVRSVNNVVDISNFCLFEYGQPLHIFDYDRIAGGKIFIRKARKDEEIITIDEVRRRLDRNFLIIADKVKPIAIAGIMGGKDTEITEATTSILIESAYFNPLAVRRASRNLALATESSYRFERGVVWDNVEKAARRTADLIARLAKEKGKRIFISKARDKGRSKASEMKINLSVAQVNQFLGTNIAPKEIKNYLERLNFKVKKKTKDTFTVTIPKFRKDVSTQADLIEEVARLYGYNKIPTSFSGVGPENLVQQSVGSDLMRMEDAARSILSSLGLTQVVTYSLINRESLRRLNFLLDDVISVSNPISYEQEIMRPTLINGILATCINNLNKRVNNIKIFELSKVYFKKQDSPREQINLAVGITGYKFDDWLRKKSALTFYDLKGILQAFFANLGVRKYEFRSQDFPMFTPECSAAIVVENCLCGFAGQLNQRAIFKRTDSQQEIFIAELNFEDLAKFVNLKKQYRSLSKYPAVLRDISLVLNKDITCQKVVVLIKKFGGNLVSRVKVFDLYSGEQIPAGSAGLSLSVEFQASDRTLTAEEVDEIFQKLKDALQKQLGAQVR